MTDKPKVKIKDYEFENLQDQDLALILAIQDLTQQIKRLGENINGR